METPTALLVIDMQLVAFDGLETPAIQFAERTLENVSGLISFCRSKNIPIIYLQTCAASGRPYAKDVHGWEIHPSITPKENDQTVYKVNSSGFEDTDLDNVLKANNVSRLITCGIWSEYCVTNTSVDGLAQGYDVIVVADAHSTVSDTGELAQQVIEKQNTFLKDNGATVLHSDELHQLLDKGKVHREEIKDRQTSHWDLDLLSKAELDELMSKKS